MMNSSIYSHNMERTRDRSPVRYSSEKDELSEAETSSSSLPDYCRTLQVKDANGTIKELVFPKALDLDRPKRARTTFSAEQLYHLEREFQRNQYLVGRDRTGLADTLKLSETQVKVWFQNRRTKYKRDQVREAEVRHANAESIATCNILKLLQTTTAPSSACPPLPPPLCPSMPGFFTHALSGHYNSFGN